MRRSLCLLLLLVLVGCKGDPPNEERLLPNLHPSPGVKVPQSLHIVVEAEGTSESIIDAKFLEGRAPDFVDAERAAWRLDRLIPGGDKPGVAFAASGAQDMTVIFRPADNRIPVLLLNRRGEIRVQLVDPVDPFPRYHGAGGRLRRPPAEVSAQVIAVERIRLSSTP